MNLGASNRPTIVCDPNAMNERPLSGKVKVSLNVCNWVFEEHYGPGLSQADG